MFEATFLVTVVGKGSNCLLVKGWAPLKNYSIHSVNQRWVIYEDLQRYRVQILDGGATVAAGENVFGGSVR